jgi:hypothetical protein
MFEFKCMLWCNFACHKLGHQLELGFFLSKSLPSLPALSSNLGNKIDKILKNILGLENIKS